MLLATPFPNEVPQHAPVVLKVNARSGLVIKG